jgi:thymidine phosphorylase
VREGTPLLTIHASDEQRLAAARERLLAAHTIGSEQVDPLPLFYQRITMD